MEFLGSYAFWEFSFKSMSVYSIVIPIPNLPVRPLSCLDEKKRVLLHFVHILATSIFWIGMPVSSSCSLFASHKSKWYLLLCEISKFAELGKLDDTASTTSEPTS